MSCRSADTETISVSEIYTYYKGKASSFLNNFFIINTVIFTSKSCSLTGSHIAAFVMAHAGSDGPARIMADSQTWLRNERCAEKADTKDPGLMPTFPHR